MNLSDVIVYFRSEDEVSRPKVKPFSVVIYVSFTSFCEPSGLKIFQKPPIKFEQRNVM